MQTLKTNLDFCQKILKLSWFIHAKYFLSTLKNRIQYLMNSKILMSDIRYRSKNKSWPQGSVRQWTPLVMTEVLWHVCTSPLAPSRTRCPGRCSSPQTSLCGSGRSSWPARSAQRSSSPHGNSWCRSQSGQTQAITPSTRESESLL